MTAPVLLNARMTLDAVMKRMEQSRAIIEAERAKVRADLDIVRPLLIGLAVRAFGKEYRITQAVVSISGSVHCYGVRLRNGRAGKRDFDIGMLHDMTILEGPRL